MVIGRKIRELTTDSESKKLLEADIKVANERIREHGTPFYKASTYIKKDGEGSINLSVVTLMANQLPPVVQLLRQCRVMIESVINKAERTSSGRSNTRYNSKRDAHDGRRPRHALEVIRNSCIELGVTTQSFANSRRHQIAPMADKLSVKVNEAENYKFAMDANRKERDRLLADKLEIENSIRRKRATLRRVRDSLKLLNDSAEANSTPRLEANAPLKRSKSARRAPPRSDAEANETPFKPAVESSAFSVSPDNDWFDGDQATRSSSPPPIPSFKYPVAPPYKLADDMKTPQAIRRLQHYETAVNVGMIIHTRLVAEFERLSSNDRQTRNDPRVWMNDGIHFFLRVLFWASAGGKRPTLDTDERFPSSLAAWFTPRRGGTEQQPIGRRILTHGTLGLFRAVEKYDEYLIKAQWSHPSSRMFLRDAWVMEMRFQNKLWRGPPVDGKGFSGRGRFVMKVCEAWTGPNDRIVWAKAKCGASVTGGTGSELRAVFCSLRELDDQYRRSYVRYQPEVVVRGMLAPCCLKCRFVWDHPHVFKEDMPQVGDEVVADQLYRRDRDGCLQASGSRFYRDGKPLVMRPVTVCNTRSCPRSSRHSWMR